jgi:hypothetical protein
MTLNEVTAISKLALESINIIKWQIIVLFAPNGICIVKSSCHLITNSPIVVPRNFVATLCHFLKYFYQSC